MCVHVLRCVDVCDCIWLGEWMWIFFFILVLENRLNCRYTHMYIYKYNCIRLCMWMLQMCVNLLIYLFPTLSLPVSMQYTYLTIHALNHSYVRSYNLYHFCTYIFIYKHTLTLPYIYSLADVFNVCIVYNLLYAYLYSYWHEILTYNVCIHTYHILWECMWIYYIHTSMGV